MSITARQAQVVYDSAELLVPAAQVEQALDRMAADITGLLATTNPLVLCVLNGGVIPVGRLLPRLAFPLQLDCLHVSRYRDGTRGGSLQWVSRYRTPVSGRTVLVVDDILDEGYTLEAIVSACRDDGAEAVFSAVLVEKRRKRAVEIEPDFVGIKVEDRYVFGYGLDYKGYLRNAPGIFAIRRELE